MVGQGPRPLPSISMKQLYGVHILNTATAGSDTCMENCQLQQSAGYPGGPGADGQRAHERLAQAMLLRACLVYGTLSGPIGIPRQDAALSSTVIGVLREVPFACSMLQQMYAWLQLSMSENCPRNLVQ